jgi:hypothetical protein
MKGRIGSLVVGVLAGAVLVATPWEGTSEAGTGPATIRITDSQIKVTRLDLGPRGTSPGDVEIVRQRLFNFRVTSRSIGRSELVCTFVDSRRARVCRGTYFLPRGKLIVGGSLQFRQFYDLAVVGGTGLFDNARGTLTVTQTARRPVRNLVVFRLVG